MNWLWRYVRVIGLWLNTDPCMQDRKLPEFLHRASKKGVGRAITKVHIHLGTVYGPTNQRRKI